ncbi:MAG: hypothetical protein N2512_10990 [Armatimonadetes bacterium]|nr:hypothetical protein [Armatimonadota bacterium]
MTSNGQLRWYWVVMALLTGALAAHTWAAQGQGKLRPKASVSAGPGAPEPLGGYPGHDNHPTKKWTVVLACQPCSYSLQHWACYHESHAPHAIALEGQIGMTSPAGFNWYHNGFFNFSLDGEAGRNYPVKAVRALDQGERGSCEFVWDMPAAWVRARFMVIPGEEPLFCAITTHPKGDHVPLLTVSLVAYPSGYFHQGQRVAVTAAGVYKTRAEAELDAAREWWVVFYDEKYDMGVEGGGGGAGGLTDPALVGRARLDVTNYPVTWTISAKPGGRELRFAFWNGLSRRNAELLAYLQPRFEPALAKLRALDFRPLRYRPECLEHIKREFEKLFAETRVPGVAEAAEAYQEAMARLEALRPHLEGDAVDIAAEEEYLATLDRLDALLWDVRMQWIFSD